jgi:hypothetical protein
VIYALLSKEESVSRPYKNNQENCFVILDVQLFEKQRG